MNSPVTDDFSSPNPCANYTSATLDRVQEKSTTKNDARSSLPLRDRPLEKNLERRQFFRTFTGLLPRQQHAPTPACASSRQNLFRQRPLLRNARRFCSCRSSNRDLCACSASYLLSGRDFRYGVRQGDDLLNLLHGEREHVTADLLGQVSLARHVPGNELQAAGSLDPDVVAS